jgi:hypothetical protein
MPGRERERLGAKIEAEVADIGRFEAMETRVV